MRTQFYSVGIRLCAFMAVWVIAFPLMGFVPLKSKEPKVEREEGEFRIVFGGKEIGSERFVIAGSDESASSSSLLEFLNPSDQHQKVRMG